MPRHTLKLLVLLTVFSVAPASGRRLMAHATNMNKAECPYARARAEAAARAAAAQPAVAVQPVVAPKGPTTITLTERARADGPLRGLGGGGLVSP